MNYIEIYKCIFYEITHCKLSCEIKKSNAPSEVSWINNLGKSLIEKVIVSYDNEIIDVFYNNDFYNIWKELSTIDTNNNKVKINNTNNKIVKKYNHKQNNSEWKYKPKNKR